MYIQITTKCNMACAHCMFSCRPGHGKNMSFSTFRKAVDIAVGEYVVIGGGEPTLHPNLIAMLGYAVLLQNDCKPFMITNGTCKQSLWNTLMRARHNKNIEIYVSKDPWHDSNLINSWVSYDADRLKLWWGDALYNRTIVAHGRAKTNLKRLIKDAKKWGYSKVSIEKENSCEVRVDPDGIVWADTDRPIRVGKLSASSNGKALDIIHKYEEENDI